MLPSGGRGDGTYHFKILVPSVAAGAIIGKGGETIAQLQKETGARVKMSKANDFYPGTTERVCLITGTADSVIMVHSFIMEKIREKPDPNAKPAIDFDNKQPAEREKQVKILVPNSTAGMIIGKGGSYIKQIKEESGAYVQISQKAKDQSLSERCITVIGEMENNRQASAMILAKVIEDPQSGSCLNVSYADVTGPIANFNPTGSPFANTGNSPTAMGSSYSPNSSSVGSFGSPGCSPMSVSAGVNVNLAAVMAGAANTQMSPAQLIENVKTVLRSHGYSEQATTEIAAAMNTLATYGVLGLGLGLNSVLQMNNNPTGLGGLGLNLGNSLVNGIFGVSGGGGNGTASGQSAAMDTTPAGPVSSGNGMAPNNNVFGPIGSLAGGSPTLGMGSPSTPRPSEHAPDTYDPFRRNSPSLGPALAPAASLHVVNNNSFGLGTNPPVLGLRKSPTPGEKQLPPPQAASIVVQPADATKLEMEVGENIVGAILGPGGKSLVEIQHFSGANIQISKKGIFAPGTRNRIVTITGTVGAVGTAQYLIEQRIAEEETKRARQNMLGVVR